MKKRTYAMRILPIVLISLAVTGCGGSSGEGKKQNAQPAEKERSVSESLPKGVKPSNDVLEMRKIAGVWRSSPGALPEAPQQIVQLEIAFDKTFTMTMWGKDPKSKGEAIFARQSGKIGMTKEGFAGSATDAKPSSLRPLASWSASFNKDGALDVKPAGSEKPIVFGRAAN